MRRLVLALALVSLAACGSVGLGDLGGILGSPSAEQSSDVRGTVNSVDTNNRVINLDVGYVNNLRETRSGQTIYYDSNTRVEFNNNTYNVTDLERGDEVSIRGHNDNGRYVAETITVTRNVRQ
jgi:hypothetical protein